MTDTTEQKALALVEECSEYGALYKNYREVPNSLFHKALCRAADRIEQLTAEVERLRAEDEISHALLTDAKAEIKRLTADNHKLMLWNEQLQAELDIARRALEGK